MDYSGVSGADALIVTTGAPGKGGPQDARINVTTVTLGKTPITILTFAGGKPPEARVEGDQLVVGGQTLTYQDGKFTLGTFHPRR